MDGGATCDARQVRERIVYSDNHLLAVNKPAGLLTQESGSGRDNLYDQARAWVRRKIKTGAVFACITSARSARERHRVICAYK